MKTRRRTEPRYRLAIGERNRQADALRQLMGMGGEEFSGLEFEAGINLLDNYWREISLDTKHRWKEQLATNRQVGYWKWFINYKRQEDALFLNDYRPVHEDNLADYGPREAARMMRQEYQLHLRALAHCQPAHNRLYHFIIQQKTLTV